ncbi:DUF480 domain-containing protein [Erwinia sp. CPCC 100877]|nr:DUF480 domain-containing protein [Erwinia sp. CPCC 100877]
MEYPFSPMPAYLIGSLRLPEKRVTIPNQYPASLNDAVIVNQKTNCDPVVSHSRGEGLEILLTHQGS